MDVRGPRRSAFLSQHPAFVLISSDTIVALSTPPGRSGIGVVRLSGPAALDIARALTRDASFNPEPHHASLKSIYDLKGNAVVSSNSHTSESLSPDEPNANCSNTPLLDQAVITYFKAPNS